MTLLLEDGPEEAVGAAAAALRAEGVVLFPTDTVYGLLALSTSGAGYRRIYEIKARSLDKPLQLLAAAGAPLADYAAAALELHHELAAQFRLGEVTVVVDPAGAGGLPPETATLQPGPVGVRMPAYPALQALLAALGPMLPLWATSANRSGEPPLGTADAAREWLAAQAVPPALAVLSRAELNGRPSMVVEVSQDGVTVLRP